MSEKEQQFERIYKETENFERTQFVREIQMQINDNKKKDKEIERLKEENRTYQEYPFIIVEKNGVICCKNQEIERLKTEIDYLNALREDDNRELQQKDNIINGIEKFFEYEYDNEVRPLNDRKISVWTICLDKLKELKESGNNE